MDRRCFIGTLALETLAVPRLASAQPERKVYRIGVLSHSATTSDMVGPEPRQRSADALVQGLRELGYVYGEHFVTEPRGAEGRSERLPSLAAELVRLQVDVIVASGPTLAVLKQATSTIPVVMLGAGDPVAQGYVQSLSRPGRNFTGLSSQTQELVGKRLELLKELVPGPGPVAVLWDPRGGRLSWQAAESAARERGWKLLSLEIRHVGEIEGAFKTASAARSAALLVFTGVVQDAHAQRIAELATRSRLPAMYGLRFYVEAGGLISYSTDLIAVYRRAAAFVDKILKGAKPADLPVERPTKFDLVINLKAARSIGLTIPQQLLSRADEVIR
jgi:putative ABC transport system substrate-binding protein